MNTRVHKKVYIGMYILAGTNKLRSLQKDVANLFEQRSRSLISHLELPENSFNSRLGQILI